VAREAVSDPAAGDWLAINTIRTLTIDAVQAVPSGHLRLGNLCWIYDSNRVTIEGPTDLAFSEDVPARFRACGWQVRQVSDVTDLAALRAAYAAASPRAGRGAHADRGGHGHRHRRADQAGHRGSTQRAARRGGSTCGQTVLWLAEDASFLVPDEAYQRFRRRGWGTRPAGPGDVGPDADALPAGVSGGRVRCGARGAGARRLHRGRGGGCGPGRVRHQGVNRSVRPAVFQSGGNACTVCNGPHLMLLNPGRLPSSRPSWRGRTLAHAVEAVASPGVAPAPPALPRT
jgi:Transketolase, thiamine diphosphate binding domain